MFGTYRCYYSICANRNLFYNGLMKCIPRLSPQCGQNVLMSSTSSTSDPQSEYPDEKDEADPFFQDEIVKYKKAKRWLATMMGEDHETFTQKQINESISYLLPSHLWAKDARPQMKHPYDTFPRKKELEFDKHNRPIESSFYTGRTNYLDLVYKIWSHMEKLDSLNGVNSGQEIIRVNDNQNVIEDEDKDIEQQVSQQTGGQKDDMMQWITKLQLQQKINEKITDKNYEAIKLRLQKLSLHEHAHEVKEFLDEFKVPMLATIVDNLTEVDVYEDHARSMGYRRKAIAEVILRHGTGTVTINTRPLYEYFKFQNDREQIMFPLLLIDGLSNFDVECHVIGGGIAGKSGAIRLGLSRALAALCPEHYDTLNDAGLLIRDARRKERKKPGRKKARRAFQWVKR